MINPPPEAPLHDLYIGRQTVYNAHLGVHSYELLFRSAGRKVEGAGLGDGATASVILAAFQDIGVDRLAGDRPVTINLSPGLLKLVASLPVPPQRVIFDLPHELANTRALPALQHLKMQGYTLALDDFRFGSQFKELYELVDFIKIDVRATDRDHLERLPGMIAKLGARSVAKKVESLEEYESLRDIGFEYFQGYFLSRPRIMRTRNLASSKHSVLMLLSALYDPDSETRQIEAALETDPGLSYKLIRMINSAFFCPPRTIESLQDAIVMLGRRKLAAWAALIVLGQIDDRPSEILRIALTRAKMCELLAEGAGYRGGDGFVVGLFSALDLLLDQPLQNLLKPLPLGESLKDAVLTHTGPLGRILLSVLAYELGHWEELDDASPAADALRKANLEAVEWASSLGGLLTSR